jgi:hypothetical protein
MQMYAQLIRLHMMFVSIKDDLYQERIKLLSVCKQFTGKCTIVLNKIFFYNFYFIEKQLKTNK